MSFFTLKSSANSSWVSSRLVNLVSYFSLHTAKPANMPHAILEPYFEDLAGKLKNCFQEQTWGAAQEIVQTQ